MGGKTIRKKLSQDQLRIWRSFYMYQAGLFLEVEQRLTEAKAITMPSYSVLITLWSAPERRLRLADLAKSVSIRRSSLSRLLDRLEEAKLLQRHQCTKDGRGLYAQLTQKGIREMAKAWVHYEAVVHDRFFAALSEVDQREMDRLLKKLNSARET